MSALGEIQHFNDLCEEFSPLFFSLSLLPSFSFISVSFLPVFPTHHGSPCAYVQLVSCLDLMSSIGFYKKPYRHLFSPFLYLSWCGNKPFADLPLPMPLSSSALPNISTPLYLQGKVGTLYCGIDCSL